jgi:hypothetical protein
VNVTPAGNVRAGEARAIAGEDAQQRRHGHLRAALGHQPIGVQPSAPRADRRVIVISAVLAATAPGRIEPWICRFPPCRRTCRGANQVDTATYVKESVISEVVAPIANSASRKAARAEAEQPDWSSVTPSNHTCQSQEAMFGIRSTVRR